MSAPTQPPFNNMQTPAAEAGATRPPYQTLTSQSLEEQANSTNPFSLQRLGSLRDVLFLFKERWIWALSAALLVACAFTFFALSKPPMYFSKSVLRVDIQQDNIINYQQVVDDMATQYSLTKYIDELKSGILLRRVLASLSAKEREQITAPYSTPNYQANIQSIVAGARSFRLKEDTLQLVVAYLHRDPEAAALLANRTAQAYQQYVQDTHRGRNQNAIDFLKGQTHELRKKVEEAEMKIQDFRQQRNMVNPEENQNILMARIQSLTANLTTANLEFLNVETQINQIETAKLGGKRLTEIPAIAASADVARAYSALEELNSQREILAQELLERHPQMLDNAERVRITEAQLQRAITRTLADLKNKRTELSSRKAKYQQELFEAEQGALDNDRVSVEYNILVRNMQSAQKTYDQVLSRLNETIVSSQLESIPITLVDTATPGQKISPIAGPILRKSFILFVLIFITVPIVIELFDNRLKTQWDIEHFLGEELLGTFQEMEAENREDIARIVLDTKDEAILENFRALYTHMELKSQFSAPKTLLVTSTQQSEGKSFISLNLAATYARHGQRTLILDCDYRRPRQHRSLGLRNDYGLLRWYQEGAALEKNEDLTKNKHLGIHALNKNLHLLRAGGTSRASTEIIRSAEFGKLFEKLKHNYDVIIVDTPPSGLFPDTLLLGNYVDEVLYICSHNAVNRHKVKHFIAQLNASNLNVLGVVWNRTKKTSHHGYGSYGYGYYARYYDEKARDRYYADDTQNS